MTSNHESDLYARCQSALGAGDPEPALRSLDELLTIYAKRGDVAALKAMLEDLVAQFPDVKGLRARLAAVYQRLGQTVEALTQLDSLGELYLDAGMDAHAREVIQQIMALLGGDDPNPAA